jgi:hypothetical protein
MLQENHGGVIGVVQGMATRSAAYPPMVSRERSRTSWRRPGCQGQAEGAELVCGDLGIGEHAEADHGAARRGSLVEGGGEMRPWGGGADVVVTIGPILQLGGGKKPSESSSSEAALGSHGLVPGGVAINQRLKRIEPKKTICILRLTYRPIGLFFRLG